MKKIFCITVLNLVDTARCKTYVFTNKNSFEIRVEQIVSELENMDCYCDGAHLDSVLRGYHEDASIPFTSESSGRYEFIVIISFKYI